MNYNHYRYRKSIGEIKSHFYNPMQLKQFVYNNLDT